MSKSKKKKFDFHFRTYKGREGKNGVTKRHPKLIVDEKGAEYGYMGLTHSDKSGHHKNIKLNENPNHGSKKDAYIRNELRYDRKSRFYDRRDDLKLSQKDYDEIAKRVAVLLKKKGR